MKQAELIKILALLTTKTALIDTFVDNYGTLIDSTNETTLYGLIDAVGEDVIQAYDIINAAYNKILEFNSPTSVPVLPLK